jgi:hypothetical protein
MERDYLRCLGFALLADARSVCLMSRFIEASNLRVGTFFSSFRFVLASMVTYDPA